MIETETQTKRRKTDFTLLPLPIFLSFIFLLVSHAAAYIKHKNGYAIFTDITKKCDGRKEMDITKIFAVLCGFLLIICLTLSITCLVVMRNAVQETSVWQERAEALVNELDGCVEAMKNIENEDVPVLAPDENEQNEEKTSYCLRLDGDILSVYDAEGYLLKRLQVQAILLPQKERERLTTGIWVDSWAEMQGLMQDYE